MKHEDALKCKEEGLDSENEVKKVAINLMRNIRNNPKRLEVVKKWVEGMFLTLNVTQIVENTFVYKKKKKKTPERTFFY